MNRSLLILIVVVAAFIGASIGVIFSIQYLDVITPGYNSIQQRQSARLVNRTLDSVSRIPEGLNFETAASLATPAVVYIRLTYGGGDFSLNPLEHYLNPMSRSSGSGVILTDDGYIATNNHVVEDASRIEVVMNNNQHFYAKVIGRDPNTDLALLKIKARNLPFIRYGNSDLLHTGQWVLAIGNPFDLNSTVTAGIVSAMARNIGVLETQNHLEVESFIQTDASVNPGNSGGALVNLKGELVGINSAIATTSGRSEGYAFAIPSTLVRKVMDDLLEFGQVQRGMLGIQIQNLSAELAESKNLDVVQGVYISGVKNGGAAAEAGMEPGDVILAINNHRINNNSELQEWVARHRPGESIQVTFRRNNKDITVQSVLKNFDGSSELKKKDILFEIEGATLEDVAYKVLVNLNIDGGVRLKSIGPGRWRRAGIQEGFIIAFIDKVPVDNVEDLNRMLEYKHGGILVEGVYENGEKGTYGLDW